MRCFREAIDLDPSAARAWAGVADSSVLLPLYGDTPPAETFPQATEAALRALELDDGLAEAHTALAYTRFVYEWDWEAAERGLERGIELDPGYPTAHQWYAFLLAALGRHDEAARRADRAVELDPLSLVIRSDRALGLYFARQHEEAIARFHETLELEPRFAYAHFGLAMALLEAGRLDEAVAEAELASDLAGGTSAMLGVKGHVLARAGRTAEAREVLSELEKARHNRFVKASRFALIYAGLGETQQALRHLEKACEERSRFMVFLAVWPAFDGLRDSDGFAELLDRVGLA